MHHALFISRDSGSLVRSGLDVALEGLSLAVHQAASLHAAPDAGAPYAVVIVEVAPNETPPGEAAWRGPDMAGAIRLLMGDVPATPPPGMAGHLRAHLAEQDLAAALAGAGYALPFPEECAVVKQHLASLVDDDPAIAAQLSASLVEANRADLNAFRQACGEGRWADAAAHAHRIRGAAQLSGMASLARLSARIEALARAGQGQAVQALAALYVPAVDRVSEVLAA